MRGVEAVGGATVWLQVARADEQRVRRADQSALYRRLAAAFYGLVNWGGRVRVPADAGDYRLLDRRVVEALKALPERENHA